MKSLSLAIALALSAVALSAIPASAAPTSSCQAEYARAQQLDSGRERSGYQQYYGCIGR